MGKPAATSAVAPPQTTPKKRVDKVVTAKPVSTESKSSPKVDAKPSKGVKDAVTAIQQQIQKENGVNEINKPAIQPQQPQPSDKPPQTKPEPERDAQPTPKQDVTLEWTPRMGANVLVTGSFCDWKEKHPVATKDGSYKVTLSLPPGKHLYKFIVDGAWFYDFTQPTETDSEGNVNNVVIV